MSDTAKASRTPRSVEKREQEVRTQDWTPPNMLPDPLPKEGTHLSGFVFQLKAKTTL